MSQKLKILTHLKCFQSITPIDALNAYGCMRLASRIDELRTAGYRIDTVMEKRNGRRYARYVMRKQKGSK